MGYQMHIYKAGEMSWLLPTTAFALKYVKRFGLDLPRCAYCGCILYVSMWEYTDHDSGKSFKAYSGMTESSLLPENGGRFTRDHIVPALRGGSNAESNLVMACNACNTSKSDLTSIEYVDWSRAVGKPLSLTGVTYEFFASVQARYIVIPPRRKQTIGRIARILHDAHTSS